MKLKLLSMLTAMLLVLTLVACPSSNEKVENTDNTETEVAKTDEPESTDRSMTVPDTTAVSNAIKDYDKVSFAMDSTALNADSKKALDMQAEILNKFPSVKVTLEGHADKVGGAEHNMKLSERRAKAVKGYLVKKGVSGERINTVGLGEDQDMRAVVTKVAM